MHYVGMKVATCSIEKKNTQSAFAGNAIFSAMLATLIDQMKHQRKHFMVYINIYFLIIDQLFIKIEETYENYHYCR